jgi:hypothetical protein
MKPEFKQVNCPFMRSVLSADDAPRWDSAAQEMDVDDLLRWVRDQPGSGSMQRVLRFFAVLNHGLGNRAARQFRFALGFGGRFSTKLVGSDGDHAGDSHIYRHDTGEFDAAEFDAFAKSSSDGATMTVADFGAAIHSMNRRHGGTASDAVQSAGEFALLAILLGDSAGTVRVADMRVLFEENRFPDGARANIGDRTAEQWLALSGRITDAISAAAARAGDPIGDLHAEQLRTGLRVVFGGV